MTGTPSRKPGDLPRNEAWTFLTSHAQVLLYIASNPGARVRDIGYDLDLTERYVYRILRDLDDSGYISRKRNGRRVEFTIHEHETLRADVARESNVFQLLQLLDPPATDDSGGSEERSSERTAG
jgi:DNA-binding MarR family transcriptional regulator